MSHEPGEAQRATGARPSRAARNGSASEGETPLRRASAIAALSVLYIAIAVWLTWPLAAHLATQLPNSHGACRFDLPAILWILSTASRNLLGDPAHLLSGNAFHPEPQPLAYGPLALGALPLYAPVFLATDNPALAGNVLLLGGVALTALSLHLVVERWTASHLAGFVAAWVLLTDRWLLWEFVPTSPYWAMLVFFPPIVALAAAPRPGGRWIWSLAALALLQALVDQVYVAPAVIAPLGALAALRLARRSTRPDGWRLTAATGLALAGLVPFYLPYAAARLAHPALANETVWRASANPVPLGIALFGYRAPASIAPAAVGLIALGALLRLASRWRARASEATPAAAWVACLTFAAVGALLALPRVLSIAGAAIEVPWLAWLPLGLLRGPERLAVATLIGLCLAAGLAFGEIRGRVAAELARLRSAATRGSVGEHDRAAALVMTSVAIALVAMSYREYRLGFGRPAFERRPLPVSYPLMPAIAPDSAIVAALRRGAGPVLELPLGPFDVLPPFHARAMYRAILHRRPVLNGYLSYLPPGFRERMALAARLPDRVALRDLAGETGLTQILVQTDEIEDPAARELWRDLAAHGRDDLVPVARDGGTLLFTVRLPEPEAADDRG